jgi:glycosyltransferase involved in cell wall biosynthesis
MRVERSTPQTDPEFVLHDAAGQQARPTASVLLPTHNRPVWLARALRSVLEAEFEDFEIVVSNNGRPGDTEDLRKSLDDPRIRWIEHAPPGALENFLSALSLARGEYVTVLHDDDWWHPRFLATLVPLLEDDPAAVLAFSDHWQVGPDGETDTAATEYISRASGRATLPAGRYQPFDALVVRETVPIPGCVFRRDALSPADFPPEVGAANDIWAAYLLSRAGGAAYVCAERLVYRTVHAESDFASRPVENLSGAVYCQQRWLRDPRMTAEREELKRRLAARQQSIGAALLRQGRRHAAREHLAAALRVRPTIKGLGAWTASWILSPSVLRRL